MTVTAVTTSPFQSFREQRAGGGMAGGVDELLTGRCA